MPLLEYEGDRWNMRGDQTCWSTKEIYSIGAEWRGTNESRLRRSTRRRHRCHSGGQIEVIAHFVCVTWVTQPTHWVGSHWPNILVGCWPKKVITLRFMFWVLGCWIGPGKPTSRLDLTIFVCACCFLLFGWSMQIYGLVLSCPELFFSLWALFLPYACQSSTSLYSVGNGCHRVQEVGAFLDYIY
jgi:hypothetical protein